MNKLAPGASSGAKRRLLKSKNAPSYHRQTRRPAAPLAPADNNPRPMRDSKQCAWGGHSAGTYRLCFAISRSRLADDAFVGAFGCIRLGLLSFFLSAGRRSLPRRRPGDQVASPFSRPGGSAAERGGIHRPGRGRSNGRLARSAPIGHCTSHGRNCGHRFQPGRQSAPGGACRAAVDNYMFDWGDAGGARSGRIANGPCPAGQSA